MPHWVICCQVQTVAETPTFTRQADKLFSELERRELIDHLAENPLAGDEIPGTGGVRKLRFAALGRGKRGGARGDLLLRRRLYAGLCASRLCEVGQDRLEPSGAPGCGRNCRATATSWWRMWRRSRWRWARRAGYWRTTATRQAVRWRKLQGRGVEVLVATVAEGQGPPARLPTGAAGQAGEGATGRLNQGHAQEDGAG